MTDKELIARLRDAVNGEHDMTPHGADCLQAADRIEALTEQLEAARADAKEAEDCAEELAKERDEANEVIDKQGALLADAYGAYLDWDEVLKDRADHECKAKLAKAVEALREIAGECGCSTARAVIAEIEGKEP
jgi:hypothetical protein